MYVFTLNLALPFLYNIMISCIWHGSQRPKKQNNEECHIISAINFVRGALTGDTYDDIILRLARDFASI